MDRDVVDRVGSLLRERPDVVTAIVFGSALTRDDARDVDVAVVLAAEGHDGAAEGLRRELALQAELSREIGVEVDLHALERLPVDLQLRVLTTGHVVVDRDPAARVRSEVRARQLAEDLRPLLDVVRRGARDRLLSRG